MIQPARWNLPSRDVHSMLAMTPPTSDPPMPSSTVIQKPDGHGPGIEVAREHADDEADDDHPDDAENAHVASPKVTALSAPVPDGREMLARVPARKPGGPTGDSSP